MLMEVHNPNHPGRHIIPGVGTHTEHTSGVIDEQIRGTEATAPSYMKDSSHFLHFINNTNIRFFYKYIAGGNERGLIIN